MLCLEHIDVRLMHTNDNSNTLMLCLENADVNSSAH